MTSPVEIAEPLEGITDAIAHAAWFLDYARAHRDHPQHYRDEVVWHRNELAKALQALK